MQVCRFQIIAYFETLCWFCANFLCIFVLITCGRRRKIKEYYENLENDIIRGIFDDVTFADNFAAKDKLNLLQANISRREKKNKTCPPFCKIVLSRNSENGFRAFFNICTDSVLIFFLYFYVLCWFRASGIVKYLYTVTLWR